MNIQDNITKFTNLEANDSLSAFKDIQHNNIMAHLKCFITLSKMLNQKEY
jgi:hypothetical protein